MPLKVLLPAGAHKVTLTDDPATLVAFQSTVTKALVVEVEVDEPNTQRECATHTQPLSTWKSGAYMPRAPHKTKRFGLLDTIQVPYL